MKSTYCFTRRASRFPLLLCYWLMGLCLATLTASACLRWVQRTDVGSPGPRYAHSLAYDPQTGLVVFFGGQFSLVGGDPEFFNDVWTYDGVRWTKVEIIGPSPSPRSWASFAAWNGQLRLGHGIGYGGVEESEWHLELSGFGTGLWTQYPSFPPNQRWDPRGFQANGGNRFVWKTEISGVPLPIGSEVLFDLAGVRFPSGHELAGRPLLTGGGTFPDGGDNFSDPEVQAGELVEFTPNENLTAWVRLSTGPRPQNRAQHVAAFDTNRNRVVMFGGAGIEGAERYWELAKVNNQYQWQRMDWIGNIPDGRAHAQMVYDERRKVTVLFGGIGGPGFTRFGDTWELVNLPPQTFVIGPTNVDRCVSEEIYLYASHSAGSPSSVQWFMEYGDFRARLGDETNTTLQVYEQMGAARYFYTVRDGCDNVATSAVYTVTTHSKPTVSVFAREEACPGDEVELTASISSTLPCDLKWFHNGSPIGDWISLPAGNFQPVLVLTNVQPTNAGIYSVVGYNRCGYATNSALNEEGSRVLGKLRVGPTILGQTVGFSSPVGGVGGAGVLADGTGQLRYQWRLDGVPITNDTHTSGADTNEIVLRGVRHNQRGNYDVIVWDDCGRQYAVTSSIVQHTVFPGPDWLIRTNPGPSARYRHTMAYDSGRHVTVLFGGYHNTPTNLTSYNDLWEWDGMRWLQRTTNSLAGWEINPATGGWRPSYSGVPVGRAEHAMAYDPKRGRVVIFGGAGIDPNGVSHNLNDTWEWDGAQWAFRGTNGPGWRSGAAMAYDTQRQVIGLYGGVYSSAEVLRGEFWEWNGVEWKIRPTFGNVSAFANTISMAYDSFRNQFIYGPTYDSLGTFIDNFWILKGSNWTSHGRAFNNQQNPAAYGSLVYDSDRRRSTYTFGTLGHTALGDGVSWEVLTNPAPAFRFWHASAYDSDRLVVVLFGGTFGFNQYYSSTNDTWELTYVDVPQIRAHPGSQVRQVNEFAEFTVDVIGHAPLSYQWLRNGVPMANDARISGVNTNVLRVANITSNDAALYQVRIENACGTTLSRPAFLTLNPNLQIFNAAGEISLLWNVSNSVLEQADNVSGPWIPVPGASNPFHPGTAAGLKLFRLRQLP